MEQPLLYWGIFAVIVVALLAFDLGVLHRHSREISVRSSMALTLFYIVMGLSFGAWVWYALGAEAGKEYFTGYLVEKTLSMDNIFMMSVLLSYFAIPRIYHHRVLFWGILGVIILRGIMIGIGAVVISQFHWVLYIFAAFLIYLGIKLFFHDDDGQKDFSSNRLLLWIKGHIRITHQLHGGKFWVKEMHPKKGVERYYATPLFLALLMIEATDVIFALDSIPAIFAITTDPYIVFTSNIFAILGLRAMYFALSALLHRFHYLKYALATILVFIGAKVFAEPLLGVEKVPASISLGFTVAVLAAGIIVSLLRTRNEEEKE